MDIIMGKRSTFERIERDYYRAPYAAVEPLILHLPEILRYCEPCAGDGALINHLNSFGYECKFACDIEPQDQDIVKCNALNIYQPLFEGRNIDYIITNPPWSRNILHPMIDHFRKLAPTWLLFDADWMFTKQAAPYLPYCQKIVSVGRVKWFPDSDNTGKDNAAWYLFLDHEVVTEFVGSGPRLVAQRCPDTEDMFG